MRFPGGLRPGTGCALVGSAQLGYAAAAVAGTAIAGPTATTSVSKKQTKKIAKKQGKKQANKAVASTLPIGAEELGSISESEDSTTIAPGAPGTAEASCGERKVISGGWKDNAPPDATTGALTLPYEDHRTNDGWRFSGFAAPVTPRTVTVYAYCLDL